MLKISGQWVNPSEIGEYAASVNGISEVAVIGVPRDDGLVRLVLIAVAKDPNAD